MSYQSESFEDRIVRLLGPSLTDPERTKMILARWAKVRREKEANP
jgi:hypothetical protein